MIRPPWHGVRFAAYVVLSLLYLAWRVVFTRNPEAPIYSWAFLAAEAYAIWSSITFYWVTLERHDPEPPPPPPGLEIDVFICTYNEPVALLRQTARRALAMDYPHRTWLCDDGRRPAVRALAEQLGCGYLTREQNLHYKAGNLNNALRSTRGDLVVVLDADHLVRRDFLTSLLGHFHDPQVAVVQTPQVYYNIDSFQHHFQPRRRRLWHEGAIFHHAIQPGANRWNAAFFVGTGAILRRSALEAIGGFATGSITEDAFTCMRLHGAGYHSVYHDEPLGYLLAPESLLQYLVQRLRWGQGSMQILRMENPLTRPGLTFRQRLVYFTALSSFSQALVHLFYYLAPALFLLGGPAPLRADRPSAFLPLLAHIVVDLAMFRWCLGPLARPLLSECYKFLNIYVFLKSLTGYLKRAGRLRFQVTPKGRDSGASLRLLAPQLVLLLLNATAFGHGVLRLTGGAPAAELLGAAVATAFSGLFVVVGAMAFLFAWDRIAAHAEYTFPDAIPARVRDRAGAEHEVTVVRVNEAELHFVAPAGIALPDEAVEMRLQVHPFGELLPVRGHVTAREATEAGTVAHLQLEPLPDPARDLLFDRIAEHAMPSLLDPLVQQWNGRTHARRRLPSSTYYLQVQRSVL